MTTSSRILCPKCGESLPPQEPDLGGRVRCHCGALFVPEPVAVDTAQPGEGSGAVPAPLGRAPVPVASSRVAPFQDQLLEDRGPGQALKAALFMPLCGLAVTVLIYAAAWALVRGSFIGAVLFDRGLVPYVVMFLSSWSGCLLAKEHRRLKREREALSLDLLPAELGQEITTENAGAFRTHIRGAPVSARGTLITRRLLKALHHFEVRGSGQELSEYLSRQSENDQAVADNRYAMIRVFIWAIPILGFIGTVLGIGEAVGMFSDAIEATGELQAIKDSLGGVTTGLAWAFDTTLVALVMSLIVMLPTSSLQTKEEHLVADVDEYCDEHLVRRVHEQGGDEPLSRVVQEAVKQGLAEHADRMDGWTQRVEGLTDVLAEQVAQGWRKVQAESSAHYEAMLAQTANHHAEVLEKYRTEHAEVLGRSDAVLAEARAEGLQIVEATRATLVEFAQARAREGERLEESLTRWQEQQVSVQGEMVASAAAMSGALTGAREAMVRETDAAREAIKSALEAWTPEMARRLTALGEQATEQWAAQLARLAELQERTGADLERAQAAVTLSSEEGAQRLAGWGAEFRDALTAAGTSLSEHLTDAVAVLRTQVQEAAAAHAAMLEGQRSQATESSAAAADQVTRLQRASEEIVSSVRAQLGAALESQQGAAEASRRAQSDALEAWAVQFKQATSAAGAGLESQFSQSRSKLEEALTAVGVHLQQASEIQARLVAEQRTTAQASAAGLERASERVEERATEGAAALSQASTDLVSVIGSRLEEALQRQLAAIEEARREQSSTMTEAAERIAASLERAQDKLNDQARALSGAVADQEQLVALQRGLAANLEVLARSDSLAQTLSGLDARLALLNETLTGIDSQTRGERGLLNRFFRGGS